MYKYARRMEYMAETAAVVNGLFSAFSDPELITLGIGAPAREALPVEIIREIGTEIMTREGRGVEALQYGPVQGLKDLREVTSEVLLKRLGIDAGPEEVMITAGGLESLTLTCELFIEPGDVILVESPTFVHAAETFEMFEARLIGVAMDDAGMDMADLENKVKEYQPKMVYIIPTFQNPTGRTLPLERRKQALELAERYGFLILEDDPYRELRYSGEELPAIRSFDTSGRVIFCNSFSKIFSAGSRLGYMVAGPDMMGHLKNAKSALNSHTAMLPQILCAEFFRRGHYEAHLESVRALYRERRDVMMECLDRFFPEGTRHSVPDGGLFTWVELPGGLDTKELLKEAVTRPDVKVSYVPGEKYFVDGEPPVNCMRISFGGVPVDKIRIAAEKLGKLVKEKLEAEP